MTNNWMSDPAVANIDKAKQEFLQALVFESQTLSDTIVNVIRNYSTPEELAKIDKLLKLRRK